MIIRQLTALIAVFMLSCVLTTYTYSKSGLDLIPYEARTLFSVKMNRQKIAQAKKNPKLAEQINKASDYGIDINRITQVYGASLDQELGGKRPNMIIVAEGQFNQASIYSHAAKKHTSLKQASHLGETYLASDNATNYSVAVLQNKLYIFAKEKHLKSVIGLYKGQGRTVRNNQSISGNVKSVQGSNFVWAVHILPDTTKNKLFAGSQFASLKSIDVLTVNYSVGGTDSIRINGICSTAKEASEAQKAIKGFVDQLFTILSLVVKNDKSVMEIPNNAKYSASGNVVTAHFTLNQNQTTQLLNLIK